MSLNYKTVSFTPKGETAAAIWEYCKHPTANFLMTNPQTLVRTALADADIIPTKQPNCADFSSWRPGESIRTSLWEVNAQALTAFAEQYSTTKQEVIKEIVVDYMDNGGRV